MAIERRSVSFSEDGGDAIGANRHAIERVGNRHGALLVPDYELRVLAPLVQSVEQTG